MPLPNDPLSRWWVEAAEENPTVADGFRQCLLALLAFGPSLEPAFVGSAFVIGDGDGFALALTARHVLPTGVQSSQRPSARHAASALFVPPSWSKPSLDPKKLKALWMGPRTAKALNLAHVSYNDSLDISSFLVVPQEGPEPLRTVARRQPADVPGALTFTSHDAPFCAVDNTVQWLSDGFELRAKPGDLTDRWVACRPVVLRVRARAPGSTNLSAAASAS